MTPLRPETILKTTDSPHEPGGQAGLGQEGVRGAHGKPEVAT